MDFMMAAAMAQATEFGRRERRRNEWTINGDEAPDSGWRVWFVWLRGVRSDPGARAAVSQPRKRAGLLRWLV